MKKFLVIDDDSSFIRALSMVFKGKPDVRVIGCLSTADALKAIRDFQPDVVFLDHNLGHGGEGFEVVKRVTGVKFYSTTADRELEEAYRERGIELIGPDFARIMEIIETDDVAK